jgi:nucleotide-binding universal stress UspA family protein
METRPRILVATDFSRSSEAALDHAVGLARKLNAEVAVAHVVPLAPAGEIAPPPVGVDLLAPARESLERIVSSVRATGVPARGYVRLGETVLALLAWIDELEPALVVVGSHGKRALERILLGSVAESLVRHSRVPVLVIPSPQAAARGKVAWACADCGHILRRGDTIERCARCGRAPVRWLSAPVEPGRADQAEPAVADYARDELPPERANDPAGLFATSPAGTSGYDVNPELRVRY